LNKRTKQDIPKEEKKRIYHNLKLKAVVDSLVVDCQFILAIGDDKDTDETRSVAVSRLDLIAEATLIDNFEAGFEITGLGHGDELAIIGNVDDTVLLVYGTHHAVEDDGRRRVGNDTGFFVKLTGEEVYTEVAVLARGGRGSDANDLAGARLEDDDITDTDVVARDRVGGGGSRSTTGGNLAGDSASMIASAAGGLGGGNVDTVDLADRLASNAAGGVVEGVENVIKAGTQSLEVVGVDVGVARATHFL